MKVSVRRKVANGLVIFLQTSAVLPRVAETATSAVDTAVGLGGFIADDIQELRFGGSSEAAVEIATQPATQAGRVGGHPAENTPLSQHGEDPSGGDPTGGDPTGGDPTGGDPTGGDPTGGDPTGGDPTGGDPSGGDFPGEGPPGGRPPGIGPPGGSPPGNGRPDDGLPGAGPPGGFPGEDPSGGDPTGGDPTGGDPTGGDPTGGDPTGGDPTGGDPTGGDPTGGDPTGGDPTGGDPTGGDPTGGDPTGGDPTGGETLGQHDPQAAGDAAQADCAPAGGPVGVKVTAPPTLITAEDGNSDRFEISLTENPQSRRFLHVVSTRPEEAEPVPQSVTLFENACEPQTVSVIGRNDSAVDGDGSFAIEIRDEQQTLIQAIPGVNLDNDDYPDVGVDVLGPAALAEGSAAAYTVRVANLGSSDLRNNSLFIDLTPGLSVTGYACTLLSGEACRLSPRSTSGGLQFDAVELRRGDTLLLSIDVLLDGAGPETQKVTARFRQAETGLETDADRISGKSVYGSPHKQ